MEDMTFEEIENDVLSNSIPYQSSGTFREALSYIEKADYNMYKHLIENEYKEMYED